MSFDFTVKEFIIGNGTGTPTFQFYRRGFVLNGSGGSQPSWKDIILSGNTALTLVNAKEGGLNYLTLFGGTEQLPETYIDSVTLDGKCEQNGTPTPTVPVDIVCNNGAIKYSANMANVNAQTALIGYYISTSGVVTAEANNWMYQDYIPVKPNTTYTLTMSSPVYFVSISEYSTADDSGFIRRNAGSSGDNTTLTIITGSTANYIRFGTNIDRTEVSLDRVLAINWMFNVGSSMAYQPYVDGGIYTDGTVETVTDSNQLTATAEMLLSVGDYKDTQEVLTGAVTRNIGIAVLDGTEDWTFSNAFYRGFSGKTTNKTDTIISTHFNFSSATSSAAPDFSVVGYMSINIGFKYLALNGDINAWKQYLADQYANGTPVIVVYPTSSATTETVTPQVLQKEPVTVTGSLTGLVANVVSSSHTTPTPTQPLPINSNNGVVKLSPNLFNGQFDTGWGISSSDGAITQTAGRKSFYIKVDQTKTYTVSRSAVGSSTYFYYGTYAQQPYNIMQACVSFGNIGASALTGTITIPAGANYLAIFFGTGESPNVQLELGVTATPYKPYGIYTDGTVETVGVTGKNLFNPSAITENKYISSDGKETSDNSFAISDYIYVAGASKITISTTDTGAYPFGGTACKAFYDANKNYISGTATANVSITATNPATVTIPSSAVYFRTSIRKGNTAQIEYGDTATTYEQYYNGGSATAEMLLAVGSYQDVQSVLDGNVTRKVGVKVLDGTESVSSTSSYYQITNVINCDITNRVYTICTHYKYGSATNANEFIVLSSGTGLRFNIGSFTSSTDVNAFLADQYAQGTPVIVIYPLATPTTESVTGQPLTIQAGTNIVEITQASIDNLELEVSYKGKEGE